MQSCADFLALLSNCELHAALRSRTPAKNTGTAADGETVSESYTTDHTIQSWELVGCGGALAARQTLKDQETWQDVLPTLPPDATPDCEAIFNTKFPIFTEACGYSCGAEDDAVCGCPGGSKIAWYFTRFMGEGDCAQHMR